MRREGIIIKVDSSVKGAALSQEDSHGTARWFKLENLVLPYI